MVLDDLWRLFESTIFEIPSTELLFNQYRDRNTKVDLSNAAEIRRKNLFSYFRSFRKRPSVVLIGEAPGPWGCRFSGIPFTGERQLLMGTVPFKGRQSSRDKPLLDLRKKPPYVSNSARLFWGTMLIYHPSFFVWNCVPFHPHADGSILSVRAPNSSEVLRYADILSEILSLLSPARTIAVGRKAQLSLEYLHILCDYVRHPSQGGAIKFKNGINRVFTNL